MLVDNNNSLGSVRRYLLFNSKLVLSIDHVATKRKSPQTNLRPRSIYKRWVFFSHGIQ